MKVRKENDNCYVDVTPFAKKIFGNIVKNAEICYFCDSEDKYKNIARRIIEKAKKKNCQLETDAQELIVTFTNGNIVSFWNSEWGGINKVNKK